MKVLMLGWEYPPHISGGLGTACQGLTTALTRHGVEIDFVVPRFYGDEDAKHMRLLGANQAPPGPTAAQASTVGAEPAPAGPPGGAEPAADTAADASIHRLEVPARLKPYLTPEAYARMVGTGEIYRLISGQGEADTATQASTGTAIGGAGSGASAGARSAAGLGEDGRGQSGSQSGLASPPPSAPEPAHYGGDLFSEVERYARHVVGLAHKRSFDLVHAHDWLTWPAGMAVAREHGVPLVTHAHSLEYDRSGAHPDPNIYEIERAGLRAADRVIAVSYYTRGIIHREHGIPLDRIAVVHNGVYTQAEIQSYRSRQPGSPRKTVLFLGRVTFQKGPEYFVQAAAKVVPHVPDVEFVVAGSGDMLPAMIEQVAALGLGCSFRFTGFLKGPEVERMFSMADLYVMPSVSEPFGISALEAMSYDTPVIISKQSGVSELLHHALKVDFWDVDYLANLMIGALLYPELRTDIVGMARDEVRQIHWDAAAEAAVAVYHEVLEAS